MIDSKHLVSSDPEGHPLFQVCFLYAADVDTVYYTVIILLFSENVEEMEGSFDTPATSPASMDLSYASMVTVKEHRLASVGSSITPEHSPVKSLSSPVKSGPSSPTVKVSKSSISQFSVAESRQQSAESSRARSSVMMFNGTERTEATSSDQGLGVNNYYYLHLF
ncbi:hypothetical protein DPMN_126802 [Dreissena polymorpha]|uniref:Uncharacterized protein n=1 Tax=Dreissena polymorpha TaxID=45954 RepID=A0A9D4H409_DREPO|nr:hypothetical protein DPMN_126802 [Dreissena polymorpha]